MIGFSDDSKTSFFVSPLESSYAKEDFKDFWSVLDEWKDDFMISEEIWFWLFFLFVESLDSYRRSFMIPVSETETALGVKPCIF